MYVVLYMHPLLSKPEREHFREKEGRYNDTLYGYSSQGGGIDR